jgi:hypothetical protein
MSADRLPVQGFHEGEHHAPEFHMMCAVYDPSSGRILHIHEIMRWPGARESAHDVEARYRSVYAEVELLVQQPTMVDLVLNHKTAKAFGIDMPYPPSRSPTRVLN